MHGLVKQLFLVVNSTVQHLAEREQPTCRHPADEARTRQNLIGTELATIIEDDTTWQKRHWMKQVLKHVPAEQAV